jgi:phosphatidylinositol glycan class B
LKENEHWGWCLLAGFILALSFYFRFQVAFCFVGLGIWWIINYPKTIKKMFVTKAGFLLGIGFNMYLDVSFYGKFCFTPYNYFYANIVEGRAASFGTSPWWYYIAILAALTVPLLSFFLFGLFAKSLANYKNPYAMAMLFFVLGHSAVGHKEERFVFPVMFFIVYLAAEAYRSSVGTQQFIKNLWSNKYYGWFIKGGVWFSVFINVLFVTLFAIEPYKQPVKFIKRINEEFKDPQQEIICYKQSPYTTESNLEYHFLSENKLKFIVYKDKQLFLAALSKQPTYYAIKYEDALSDSLQNLVQNRQGIVSSHWIWSFTNWLGGNYHIYIPDIWLLSKYQ